jgi:hypothetical protein
MCIRCLTFLTTEWQPARTTVFNAQILNSATYLSVTGSHPPNKPMSAALYARHGYPFFEMYEEPSGIHGDFGLVKSVAQLDISKDAVVEPRVVKMGRPVGLTNPEGPMQKFRTVRDLENECGGYHVVGF